MVAHFMSKLRIAGTKYFRPSKKRRSERPAVSPKSIAILLTKPAEDLAQNDQQTLSHILENCPTLHEIQQLGADFKDALRLRSGEAMAAWIDRASRSTLQPISRFAVGLRRDKSAVIAAASLCWSNGQVEGQVHRLKLIKRQMYGRGSFQLLRRRVLPFKEENRSWNRYRAP
jgi:transposase